MTHQGDLANLSFFGTIVSIFCRQLHVFRLRIEMNHFLYPDIFRIRKGFEDFSPNPFRCNLNLESIN